MAAVAESETQGNEEDGVYEVLDGEKETPTTTSTIQRSVEISEGSSSFYNQLQFSDKK